MTAPRRAFVLGFLLGLALAVSGWGLQQALGPAGDAEATLGERSGASGSAAEGESGATAGSAASQAGPSQDESSGPARRSRRGRRRRGTAEPGDGAPSEGASDLGTSDKAVIDSFEPGFSVSNPGSLGVGMPRTYNPVVVGRRPPPRDVVHGEWSRAQMLAAQHKLENDSIDRAQILGLLRSEEGNDVSAGIVLALAQRPPLTGAIVELARDESAGLYRAMAIHALGQLSEPDDAAFDVVRTAVRADDIYVRQAAAESLGRYGKPGQELAMELLRKGEFGHETAPALAMVLHRGRRALEFLRTAPPAEGGLAVAEQFMSGRVLSEDDRTSAAQALATYLRNISDSAAFSQRPEAAFRRLAALGEFDALSDFAGGSQLPDNVRWSAAFMGAQLRRFDALEDQPEPNPRAYAPLARLLSDRSATPQLLRDVIAKTHGVDLKDPLILAALLGLESGHPNAWVRDDARLLLAANGHIKTDALHISKATYGAGGKFVDVTEQLRALITGGRLEILVSNSIAGDPLVGTHKTLRVEYETGGKRRVKSVGEGSLLRLP